MKKMLINKIAVGSLAGWMVCGAALSAEAAGTSAAQFLKMGAGARAAAMGDAFTAIADDVSAAYWNPAGLAQVRTPEVLAMQNSGLVETQYQYLGAALPYKNSTVGVSFARMDNGTIDRYTTTDVKDGSFSAGSLSGMLSLGTKINENCMWGASVKYIQESIETVSATGFAADAGILYKTNGFTFGGSVQHIGPAMTMVKESNPLPMTIRLGVSTHFLADRLLVGVDASKPNDNQASLHAGAEYQVAPVLKIRGGYTATPGNSASLGGLTGLCGGLGIQFNRFNLDYAMNPFGDLGISQRISLRVQFGSSSN